jgi:HEAT repeat protein
LLNTLKETSDHASDNLILALGEREYRQAIPVLEEIIKEARDDIDGRRCRILAAGALCRLGEDYEENAAIVRDGLWEYNLCYTSYQVVGWLNDEETIKVVISQVGSEKPEERAGTMAIKALGQIGSKSALPALRDALNRLPIAEFMNVGEAITAVGHKSQDGDVVAEGEEVKNLATFLNRVLSPSQRAAVSSESPEAIRNRLEMERAASWLKKHPELIPRVMEEIKDFSWGYNEILSLLDNAWDERAIPYLEYVTKTNVSRVDFHTDSGIVPHYHVRSAVAAFLTRKTGRQYTFIDVDGTVRKGGETPK